LNGDDAVGSLVARKLTGILSASHAVYRTNFYVIDTGPVPENFTGTIKKIAPHLVIMIDAAQMGEEPGMIKWLHRDQISGYSAATHGLPLNLLADYLSDQVKCQVGLIGIQPGINMHAMTAPYQLTPRVKYAVTRITRYFKHMLVQRNTFPSE
jgi:hydrogenase 3 maturation protease